MLSKTIKDSNGNDILITVEMKIEKHMNGKRELFFSATQSGLVYKLMFNISEYIKPGETENDCIKELDSIFIKYAKQYFLDLNSQSVFSQLGYQ